MKIKFIRDTFYPSDTFRAKGETLDVSKEDACNLICRGKAVEVTAEDAKPAKAPKAPKAGKLAEGEGDGDDA